MGKKRVEVSTTNFGGKKKAADYSAAFAFGKSAYLITAIFLVVL